MKICPECETEGLYRVIHAVHCSVRQDPKTVGAIADRNTSKMSNAHKSEMYEKQEYNKQLARARAREELAAKLPTGASIPNPPSSEIPKVDMSLTKLTPQQTEKYIETGKK